MDRNDFVIPGRASQAMARDLVVPGSNIDSTLSSEVGVNSCHVSRLPSWNDDDVSDKPTDVVCNSCVSNARGRSTDTIADESGSVHCATAESNTLHNND